MAEQLAHDLYIGAEGGRVNYKKPVTAKAIIERYKTLHPTWKLADSTIRELVNYCRVQGLPIGSSTGGYWYILNGDGEEHFANNLESRVLEMLRAFHGVFPDRFDGLMFRIQTQVKNPGQEIMSL